MKLGSMCIDQKEGNGNIHMSFTLSDGDKSCLHPKIFHQEKELRVSSKQVSHLLLR